MEKKRIIAFLQITAIFVFVVMALACYSSSTAVDGSEGVGASSMDGAYFETPTDSIRVLNDVAMN